MAKVFSLFNNKDKNSDVHNKTVHYLLNSDPPINNNNSKGNKVNIRPHSANQNTNQAKQLNKNKGNKGNVQVIADSISR